jgi:hypothetical protein
MPLDQENCLASDERESEHVSVLSSIMPSYSPNGSQLNNIGRMPLIHRVVKASLNYCHLS